MPEFIFGVTAKKEMAMTQKWYIEDIVPMGAIVGIVAQASSGKSTLADAALMYTACNYPFLGKEINGCDVLIVDQESQRQGFFSRLDRLSNFLGDTSHKIFVEYCKGCDISSGSIIGLLNEYPSAKVILLDSWHAIAGDIDFDKASPVRACLLKLRNWLDEPENRDKTIVITHHITEKSSGNSIDPMITLKFSSLAMGSSAFVQNMDAYFIISSPNKSEKLTEIYVRPRSKRVLFPNHEPFIVNICEEDNKLSLEYGDIFHLPEPEIYSDIDSYFASLDEDKVTSTLKEMSGAMGGIYSDGELRQAMRELETKGRYGHYKGGQNNQYKYYAVNSKSTCVKSQNLEMYEKLKI